MFSWSRGRGGMSGVRFGRDQTYVSIGNPSYRKGNGRRGGDREGAVLGAGVGPGSGGNKVRFQEMLEKDGVLANKVVLGWRLLMLHRWVRARRNVT